MSYVAGYGVPIILTSLLLMRTGIILFQLLLIISMVQPYLGLDDVRIKNGG